MKTIYITLITIFSVYMTGIADDGKKPLQTGLFGTYELINSTTDQKVQDLSDGSTVDLNIQGTQLNIRAIPPMNGPAVESVRFTSTGFGRTESAPPYAYKGDLNGDYFNWQPNVGPLTITVRYYAADGASGQLLGTDILTIDFTEGGDTTPPIAPNGLANGTVTDTSVELLWNAASDNTGVTGYTIYRNGTAIVALGNVTAHTVTGLSPSTSHTFSVSALDASNNEGPLSAPLTVSTTATPDTDPPTVPTLSVDHTSENSIALSWLPSSDNVAVTAYEIYDGTGNLIASLGNVTQYTAEGLQSGTSYTYTVRALDAAGNASSISNQVNPVTLTPQAQTYGTYELINSVENMAKAPLLDGGTYNLDIVGDSLNIRAIPPEGVIVKSVRFSSTEDNHTRTEGTKPYAYFGDFADSYYHWHPPFLDAPMTITITYFSESNANGTALGEDEITITFTDQGDTQVPTTVTGLSVTNITDTTATLDWNASSDDRGVTGYNIYDGNALLATVAVPGHTLTGLAPGTAHSFTIRALDASGKQSVPSLPLQVDTTDSVPPTVPTGLTVGNVTATGAVLSWNPSTDNVAVTGYLLSINNGNALPLGNVTDHSLTGLVAGNSYNFRIFAIDAAGNQSGPSSSLDVDTPDTEGTFGIYTLINAVTDQPIREISGGQAIDLNQTGRVLNIDAVPRNSQNVGSIRFSSSDGYTAVETTAPYAYAGNNGADFSDWEPPLGPLTFTVEYFTEAEATGQRINSDTFTVTFLEGPDEEAPSSIRVVFGTPTTTTIPFTWPTSEDNVGIVGYYLFQNGQPVEGSPFGPSVTSYTATGLSPDTQYSYVIRAFDAAGNQSGGLTATTRTAIGDDTQAPNAPTNLSGTPGPGAAHTLTWTPPTDNALQGYKIYIEGRPSLTIGIDDTYAVMGLDDLTSYTFRISALDTSGNESPLSAPHTGETGDGTPPVAGTLAVLGRGETYVDISINGFSDNSGTLKYFVHVEGEQLMEVEGDQNSFRLTDLQLGNTYGVHVVAQDPSGNSVQSPAIEVAPQENTDTDPPVAPALSETARDFESIALSWTVPVDASGISAYKIFLDGVLTASLAGDQTNYTLTGLEEQRSYAIRIQAVDGAGNPSVLSTEISVGTTAAPAYESVDLTDENYVYTRTFQVGKANHSTIVRKKDVIENVVYLDGLGRTRQQIAVKQSFGNRDIITPMEYDGFGRQIKQYLPYEGGREHGTLRELAETKSGIDAYYTGRYGADLATDPNTYSEMEYEPSPLNRVLRQAAPGESWKMGNGHEIELAYRSNSAGEVINFEVDLSAGYENPSLKTNPSAYPAGELSKTITYDENHNSGKDHSTEEFTDKLGRVVLKRTYDKEVPHDTHYIYDDHNNLTFVLPPKVDTSDGVSVEELNELGFQYRYDHRNRLIEKKVPGKGWEHIVYNKLDRPILTQDPNLRAQGRWLFTKYDAFGRVAYTGFYDSALGRSDLQDNANGHTVQFEDRTAAFLDLGGAEVNYTNAAFPTADITQLLTLGYYDSYGFREAPGLPANNALGTPLISGSEVRGLPTGGRVRVLGTDHWVTTLTGYDEKRRPVHVRSENTYLDALDIVDSKLDFLGRAEQVKSVHTKDGNDPIETIDTFTYDNTGRVLTHLQDLGGKREAIARNGYDPMGLLVNKKIGGSLTAPLQDIDLSYNIRGWLTGINPDRLEIDSSFGGDLFAFGIHYDSKVTGDTPLYNGNIARTEWRSNNQSTKKRRYRYTYDALNRITHAIDGSGRFNLGKFKPSEGGLLEPLTYDKNGNILTLYRKGATSENPIDAQNLGYGVMDKLTYTYDAGNKLLAVSDAGNDNYGFRDGNTNGNDYEYDDNGNLILDRNKGINRIEYNYLNLPTQVSVSGNGNVGIIDYIYTADGTKLEKIVNNMDSTGSSVTATEYCGNYIYERIGTNAAELKFFSQPEGYIEPNGNGGYDYVYQYKDHLGNIRLSYADNNGTLEIREENNYYPFGLKHKGYNSTVNGRNHKYGFTGKEEQDEIGLGWVDITARNYDPSLGRWMNIDPLADQMRRHSPYNYAFDNPIYFQDPDGMMACPPGENCNGNGDGTTSANNGQHPVAQAFSALVNFFTSSNVTPQEKAKTVMEAVLPDKLAKTALNAVHGATGLGTQFDIDYSSEDYVKDATGELLSIAPLLSVETKLSTVSVRSKNVSIGKKVSNQADNIADDIPIGLDGTPQKMPKEVLRGGGTSPSDLKLRPGEASLSFSEGLANPISGPTVFSKSNFIRVDTSKLPVGSVALDGGLNGMPRGHVSINATVDQVKAALVNKGKFPKQ